MATTGNSGVETGGGPIAAGPSSPAPSTKPSATTPVTTQPTPVSTVQAPGPAGSGPIPIVTLGNGGSSGVASAPTLNSVAKTTPQRLQQYAAENSPIRIPYGRVALGAAIGDVIAYNGGFVLYSVWGHGPINAVESLWADEKQVGVDPSLAGITATHYTGTQTTPDALLVAAFAAQSPPISFSDVFAGLAYSVIFLPPTITTGFPQFAAIVQGLKVYDPRTTLTAYSDNAALMIADLQTNATYGAGAAVDWNSVTTTANACDALVGGEKRRVAGLVIDTPQDINAWFEALRTYAGCFLARSAGALVLIPDRPASSTWSVDESGGPPYAQVSKVRRGSKRNVPTVSVVRYTDTTVYPWRDGFAYAYAAGVTAGTVPWKSSEVALPGITRFSQANREAVERLNKLTLNDLAFDVMTTDEGLATTVGDVITVTAHVGLTAQLARVVQVQTAMLGRPVFSCERYDPGVYCDVVAAGPTIVDTSLGNPASVPPPTGLIINETAYLEQLNGSVLAGSLIYQSRFDISWTASASKFPVLYRVEIFDGTQKIRDEIVSAALTYSSPTLQQGKTYTVNVYARSSVAESVAATGTKAVLGNTVPPGPPTILSGRELGGDVLLEISPPAAVDVVRFEWRYFPNGTGTWGTATFIDRIDGYRPRFKGLPVGTHRFYVASVNSVGLVSTTQSFVDITVTSDANAFITSRTFTNPASGTNIIEITTEGDATRRWATSVTGDQWSAVEPSPLNSGGNPVDSYHASATSKFQGETWDLGSSLTGSWTMSAPATAISGTIAFYIESSPDLSVWTRQPGLSFQGAARGVRPVIEALTGSTLQVDAPPSISLAVLSKPETNIATTSASAATLIALTGKYSAAQDLQATPIGSTGKTATCDRLLVHPQSGLMAQWIVGVGTGGGVQDAYAYQKIWSGARVVLADDFLEYEVFIDPSTPAADGTFAAGGTGVKNAGAILVHTASGGYAGGAVNTDTVSGNDVRTGAGMDVRGAWIARRRALGSLVGLSMDFLDFGGDGDGNGTYMVLLRNCRITNGAGTDRLAIYPTTLGGNIQGEPSTNVIDFGGGGFNAVGRSQSMQVGPSNTFNLYAFSSAGAQIASDVRWSFKGF